MNQKPSNMKTKHTIDIHVTLTREALAKLDKQDMIEAKFEFTRPEHRPEPKRIVREASPEPMRFSLANLLPVGV